MQWFSLQTNDGFNFPVVSSPHLTIAHPYFNIWSTLFKMKGYYFLGSLLLLYFSISVECDKDSGGLLEENASREVEETSLSRSRGRNKTHPPAGFLPLPPDYNKLVIPLGNISDSIFISVQFAIREVLDVDAKDEAVVLDTELKIFWIDWEIWKYLLGNKEEFDRYKNGPPEIALAPEFFRHIWKPDIFIEEMASVERTQLLSKLVSLRFLVRNGDIPGAITFQARQTLRLKCDMDFAYYPADTQICTFRLRSYSYTEDQLFLMWDDLRSVCLDKVDDANFDFRVTNLEPGGEYENIVMTAPVPKAPSASKTYSTLSFTLEIRRNLTYHLVQTYLPSVILILITWLCFLLPPDMVEVRIGISMTTLLTLTAMFGAVRETSPEVSYAMAIDKWMVFCILLLFLALVLFTLIYWVRRRLHKVTDCLKEKPIEEALPGVDLEHQARTYKRLVAHSQKLFWLFAMLFITFLVLYSMWLIFSSGYLNWEVDPRYNAVPEVGEDGEETVGRLIEDHGNKFKDNDTIRVTKNDFRFYHILTDILEPIAEELKKDQ